MDDHFGPRPVAAWYMPAAIVCLLLMLLGCALYAMHVAADPAKLPVDQRAMFEAEPQWVAGSLGLAAAIGALGAIMLLVRRKAAVPLFLISTLLVAVWIVGLFAITRVRELLSTGDIVIALVVAALSWTIYWFARHSRQRGWLR